MNFTLATNKKIVEEQLFKTIFIENKVLSVELTQRKVLVKETP